VTITHRIALGAAYCRDRWTGVKHSQLCPGSGFYDSLGEKGICNNLMRFSVHPYRGTIPETVEMDWLRLRRLVDSFSPNKEIPFISTEWGYTTAGSFYGLSGLKENRAGTIPCPIIPC